MKELFISCLNFFGLAWWIEIITDNPHCTYYFGPFLTAKDANSANPGYIEDIEQEGAQGICFEIKRCKPSHLTVCEDLGEINDRQVTPVFSSFL